jgi:hypothetical protein
MASKSGRFISARKLSANADHIGVFNNKKTQVPDRHLGFFRMSLPLWRGYDSAYAVSGL